MSALRVGALSVGCIGALSVGGIGVLVGECFKSWL